MGDRSILARELAGAAARVATDALGDVIGCTPLLSSLLASRLSQPLPPLLSPLPLAPSAFTDPARFQLLVGSAGCSRWPIERAPLAVRISGREAPSSNCRNSVLRLDWGDDPGDLPRTLFLKQPSPDLATRLFANLIGFWRIECAVCRNLAALLPIDSPAIHAVSERRSRFFILMEDLRAREDVTLFVNRDFVAGVDVALAARCVRTLAKLHAGFVGWDAARREAALPLAVHPFLSPRLQPTMLAVNRLAIPRCRAAAGAVFGEGEAAMARRALDHWPVLQRAWYREPLTLVHGDSHVGNFFETRAGLGMLDFQGAHWSRGPRDVHYFLVNSMDPEVLARHEGSLLETYVEARGEAGAPIAAATAWDEYRGFSFQTLMTAVVSIGLGSFTDSDDVMRAMLVRAVASVRRLGFEDWLDATIAADAAA